MSPRFTKELRPLENGGRFNGGEEFVARGRAICLGRFNGGDPDELVSRYSCSLPASPAESLEESGLVSSALEDHLGLADDLRGPNVPSHEREPPSC